MKTFKIILLILILVERNLVNTQTTTVLNVIGHCAAVFGVVDFIGVRDILGSEDETSKKLEKIIDILNADLNEMKKSNEDLHCETFKQAHLYHLWSKIERLLSDLKNYETHFRASTAKESVKNVCKSPPEGVSAIYSIIKQTLKHDQILKFFKVCFQYKSKDVQEWSKNVREISTIFAFLVQRM